MVKVRERREVSKQERERERKKEFWILSIETFLGPQKHTKIGHHHHSAPLKRYLYTSFLFALEINILYKFYVFVQQDKCVKSLYAFLYTSNEGWRMRFFMVKSGEERWKAI